MDKAQLKGLLDQAIAAACLAGHYAMKQYRVDIPFSSKGDDGNAGVGEDFVAAFQAE